MSVSRSPISDGPRVFYDQVFGWPIAVDTSAHVDEPGVRDSAEQFYGGVVYQTPSGALFGLRPVGSDRFESTRTGLDHVSFILESRSDLVKAEAILLAMGHAHHAPPSLRVAVCDRLAGSRGATSERGRVAAG